MDNELDILRRMLRDAKIPFETYTESMDCFSQEARKYARLRYGDVYMWRKNQVIYGRHFDEAYEWLFEGNCQYGSYGAKTGQIEAWGKLGETKEGYPRIMAAQEAFAIIKKDWEARNERSG